VRALEDQMANGDEQAFHRRLGLIRGASAALRSMPDEVWAEPRNWRALFAYLLGGGDVRLVKDLAVKGALKDVDGALAKGIIALVDAREQEALKDLETVSILDLDIGLAAPLALALAPRLATENGPRAIEMLNDVILRAPGTLMEESALRRLAHAQLSLGDLRAALAAFSKHARRFPHSIFANAARKSFAAEIAARTDQTATWAAVQIGCRTVASEIATRFYLDIAENSLRTGRLELARNAAAEASRLAGLPDGDARMSTRAQLYRAVAEAPTTRVGESIKTFAALKRDDLSASDQTLLTVAERLARSVARSGAGLPGTELSAVEEPSTELHLKRARDLVSTVDNAIVKAPK